MRRDRLSPPSFLILTVIIFFPSYFFASPQQTAKIIGDWQVVVLAEGQYYYLSLTLKQAEEKLEGVISEVNGFFKDIALTSIKLENDSFHFEFTAPTPPEGVPRQIVVDLKIAADYEKMEGTLYLPDLGLTAQVSLTRQK